MAHDSDWHEDLARYDANRPFFKEQSLWAIWSYRYGRRVDAMQSGVAKKLHTTFYWLSFRFIETITGISLPKAASIGGGLRIWHFGSIFINHQVMMGKNCTLRHGVTIGNREEDGPVPIIGNNVDFGAYAQVLGGITIGDNCKIGAMSLVLCDVPSGATAVGVPARIVINSI